MPKLNDFDPDQICFDADTMQVLSVSRNNNHNLPLTQAPFNFSVLRSDSLLSNRWGISTNKKGDVYIYSRDSNAEKISLHASGRQHISITSEIAALAGAHSRFGPVWTQPQFDQEAIATFSLLFPPWGVGLPLDSTKFTKDELLIVGHEEKIVVVSFFLVDSTIHMQVQRPHFIIGRIPIQTTGNTLHVISWKEPQKNLKDTIRAIFPQASATLSELHLPEDDYTLNVQGFRQPNSAYMVTVPVHYTPSSQT